MRYLGGKHRQSKALVSYISSLPNPSSYHEPFCGSLSSAMAVSVSLPGVPVHLSDANRFLMKFWTDAADGFDPPETITEQDYKHYNALRSDDDPMTGCVGFACSFGGKFFGGAARTNGVIRPSWANTMKKIRWLRQTEVYLNLAPYWEHNSQKTDSLTYLDPPYIGRTPQSREVPSFDGDHFRDYAQALPGSVIASEFLNPNNWEVVHNWGDTVERHLNGKLADGTTEILMKIK